LLEGKDRVSRSSLDLPVATADNPSPAKSDSCLVSAIANLIPRLDLIGIDPKQSKFFP
jgi:hypothetical protein